MGLASGGSTFLDRERAQRPAPYYTHTHVHTPPTSVSVGAYESDNESDDAVDDQKGRRPQPESDETRAVHIHQKKDLSY